MAQADREKSTPKSKISDEELAVIVGNQERHAQLYANSTLSNQRAKALKYYMGEPFGNEVEGQSQVVSTDVFEAVEGMLPALLEIFLSSNRLAECEPYGMEDEGEARQQTEAANHVIMKMNPITLIFYTWFKDALIQKVGILKTYYETEDEYRIEQYAGLTDQEMTRLLSDDSIEPMERIQRTIQIEIDGQVADIPVNDLKVRVATKKEKIRIKNVPPENFLVSTRQNSLDLNDCEFCTHKEKKTVTDLLEMGVPQSFIEECGDDDSGIETSEERIARAAHNFDPDDKQSAADESMREIWVSDGCVMVDTDGDGVAELRHFIKIGNKIWLNEETDVIPFSAICPILLPHQFYGLSIADVTEDVALTKSTIWRQMLNNLYLTNNARTAVVEGQVELDDLLTSRPGGIVRMKAPGMAVPFVTPFVAKESFPMLEYWDSVKENRTGVTRYNQGLDADSLNKTATGINSILTQSLKRLEMVARLFAETGVKDLVRKVLHCISKSGMKQLVVKLTNGYVSIDPREWKSQYNITINVGLGTGTKDRTIQMLSLLAQKQAEMIQLGRGYLISEQNQYNLATKLSEAAGFKNPELFFTDPQAVPPEAKEPPPNPEMIKLQTDAQLKQLDMQVTSQQKDKDMANDRMIEEMKARVAAETDLRVAQIQQEAQIAVAQIRADTEKRTKLVDATMKESEMRQEAEMKIFDAKEPRQLVIGSPEAEKELQAHVDGGMQQLVQMLVQQNQQVSEALSSLAQSNQQIVRIMKAPRKRIKDKSGKTVGVEIEGFGPVTVQ